MEHMRRVLVVAVALAMAAPVLLSTAWNLRVPLSALGIETRALEDPHQIARLNQPRFTEAGFSGPQPQLDQYLSAARRDPLGDVAFLLWAMENSDPESLPAAVRALEIARAREPRNRVTRILLADGYLQQERITETIQEVLVLEHLRTGAGNILLPLLANLVRAPAFSAQTIAALGDGPISTRVMSLLANDLAPVDLLIKFSFDPGEDIKAKEDERATVARLVSPYLKAGDVQSASRLWKHYNSGDGLDLAQVTDPSFTGEPGPPFGWEYGRKADAGLIEQVDDGLRVTHFGRSRWTVLRQVLLLNPGVYRIEYAVESAPDESGSLFWRVDCVEGPKALLNISFEAEDLLGMAQSKTFTVPSGDCPAQQLVLTAEPVASSRQNAVELSSVEISPAGNL